MPVEIFTREQFESALPKHKTTQSPLWQFAGQETGEYVYAIPVLNKHLAMKIMIRSSISTATDLSADTSQDSIRVWLVDAVTSLPMSAKLRAYTTREKGWQGRLVALLRDQYKIAMRLTPCGVCGKVRHAYKTKKAGENKGRLFQACYCQGKNGGQASGTFDWLDERKA